MRTLPWMNPFDYQGPVDPSKLVDRSAELEALHHAAANAVAVRVAAPRRFGKTSLLNKHVSTMREVGHRAVRVDFNRVTTVADAAVRLVEAFADGLPSDPSRTGSRWLGRLGVVVGAGPLRLSLAPPASKVSADEARRAVLELLDLPRHLNDRDQGLTVVCFDEFQDLLTVDDALDGLVRSVIQHHQHAAAYVFAGSEPTLMRALFSQQERPFYGQARPLELGVLPHAEAAEDLERLLRADGIEPGDAVDQVLAFTGGHPQRTMLVAHHLYEQLEAGSPPDTAVAAAIATALAETRDAHRALWDELDRNERIVLTALANGQAPTGVEVASEHRVSRSTLQRAVKRLASTERHLRRGDDGNWTLLDPLLGEWLRASPA